MNDRVKLLKQLVGESHYAVDERAVAEAIMIRVGSPQPLARLDGCGTVGHGAQPSRLLGVHRSVRRGV